MKLSEAALKALTRALPAGFPRVDPPARKPWLAYVAMPELSRLLAITLTAVGMPWLSRLLRYVLVGK